MKEITAKLVEKGIIVEENKIDVDEFGNYYITYDIFDNWMLVYNSDTIIQGYMEKYVNGELELIVLLDEYDTTDIGSREEFIKYVEIFKNENIF